MIFLRLLNNYPSSRGDHFLVILLYLCYLKYEQIRLVWIQVYFYLCLFFYLGQKKSCFQKLTGWKFFYHLPTRIVECVLEYVCFKKRHTRKKKAKETKEKKEKNKRNQRRKRERKCCCEQYLQKIYDDIVCEFFLCKIVKIC